MPYTANITGRSIQRAKKQVVVDVELSNGTDTFTEKVEVPLVFTQEELNKKIKQLANHFDAVDAEINNIPTGVVDLASIDLSRPQAEQDFADWLALFARLENAQKLVDLGVVANDNPKLVALRNQVTTGLKAAYVDLL